MLENIPELAVYVELNANVFISSVPNKMSKKFHQKYYIFFNLLR